MLAKTRINILSFQNDDENSDDFQKHLSRNCHSGL